MKYAYYPGCSLEKNAFAYHKSTMAVTEKMGMELEEVEDWNCCGATEYVSIDLLPAYALIGRNLALAARQDNKQLLAPCSACFLNLSKVNSCMTESPDMAGKINQALEAGGLQYEPGSMKVSHLLEAMVKDAGFDRIEENVVKPLYGLRVAPYYGCLIVRPGYEGRFDETEYPTSLDKILTALGAEVIDFPLKTHCCGGHMTQISEDVALGMIHDLLRSAAEYKADVIATLCPMCQLNLDGYQQQVNKSFGTDYNLPVLYFTQLMGLAFGSDRKELGFGSEFVDATAALDKIEAEKPKPARKPKPTEEELPQPQLKQEEPKAKAKPKPKPAAAAGDGEAKAAGPKMPPKRPPGKGPGAEPKAAKPKMPPKRPPGSGPSAEAAPAKPKMPPKRPPGATGPPSPEAKRSPKLPPKPGSPPSAEAKPRKPKLPPNAPPRQDDQPGPQSKEDGQ